MNGMEVTGSRTQEGKAVNKRMVNPANITLGFVLAAYYLVLVWIPTLLGTF
jgi:hypothetical protein